MSFWNWWRQNITFSTKWWNWLGHMEEQSSFRELHGKSLGVPDKISKCDTISIIKATPQKLQQRITNHNCGTVETVECLTVKTLKDIGCETPLSPINLFTMKSNVVLPPPGDFKKPDWYSRRCSRRIQHIAEEFWCQWWKGFLATLQSRA